MLKSYASQEQIGLQGKGPLKGFIFCIMRLVSMGKHGTTLFVPILISTRHQNDVTKERAILLDGIVKGKPVDVGYVIYQSIQCYLRGNTSGGILHASVITRLCAKADVEWDNDSLQLPMSDIDHATIKKYKVWKGAPSHPRGLGFSLKDQEESEEELDPHPMEAPHPHHARQDREIRRLQRRMDAMHMDFRTYTTEFSGALSQAFAQLGTEAHFPIFGSNNSYPPPDTPPEQDEAGGDGDAS